jgi:16S rRNA (cytosine1402-N4)-methyltransferase
MNGESTLNAEREPSSFVHVPVLSRELIDGIRVQPGGRYLDATVGGGGHSQLILSVPQVSLVAIDQDAEAIAAAQQRLSEFGDRVQFWQGNFAAFRPDTLPASPADSIPSFDGIIADLGVSSAQFDIPERGFSFRHTAPLDMRMDQSQSLTAAEVVNTWDTKTLADSIYLYGEERRSRQIARRIVEQRPFSTTTELADAIAYAVPKSYRYGRIHPATRTFQALRIVVNRELEVLEQFLAIAPTWLKPGGYLGIISFHSLEDRIVKHTFRQSEQLTIITKKPITPQPDEVSTNVRSRSAKLRIAQRTVETVDVEP